MPFESLSPHSQEELRFFADQANWQGLHALDWQRYFDFIVGTHNREEHALPSDIRTFLIEAGGTEDISVRVSDFYEPARRLITYLGETS